MTVGSVNDVGCDRSMLWWQIRRQKQIKEERKQHRKLMRLHNKMATVIQNAWIQYLNKQRDAAAELIKQFMRYTQVCYIVISSSSMISFHKRISMNKQAVLIGGWAASKLKKFAIKV